jgi:multicomponent Na+:H+ antiporter subunit G
VAVVVDIVSWIFLLAGSALGIIGGIGIHRFPDFFSRLHATSITDTLCAALILAGLLVQEGFTINSAKLLFIFIFLLYTSPLSAHAVARAALHGGIKPVSGADDAEDAPPSKP